MKKLFALFGVLFLALCATSPVSAANQEKYSIKAHYYHNNEPMFSVQIVAKNYQTAFEKIESGEFVDDDFSHFSVNYFKAKGLIDGKTIDLGNGLVFGKATKIDSEKAVQIVAWLHQYNRSYLDYLNEFGPHVTLSNPEVSRYKFTNEEGIAVGTIQAGLTVFVSSASSRIVIEDIQEDSEVYVGNTQPYIDSPIQIVHNEKAVTQDISTDVGQKIIYKIPIKTESLQVDLSPNFKVTSSNVPYNEIGEIKNTYTVEDGKLKNKSRVQAEKDVILLSGNGPEEYVKMLDDLPEKVSKLHSIKTLDFDLSTTEEDFLLIEGVVVSELELPFQIKYKDTFSDEESETTEKITIYAQPNQGIFVRNSITGYLTPRIDSYGANFVVTDATSNSLLSGTSFALLRTNQDNQTFVYTDSEIDKWRLLTSELDKKMDGIKEFSSGKIYYADGQFENLDFYRDVWNFDKDEQQALNDSLLKLRGFSGDYNYQLVALDAPDNYALDYKSQTFALDEESLAKAQFPNYLVNGYIIDQEYNLEDYNALSLLKDGNRPSSPNNPSLMAGLGILTIVIICLLVIVVLFRMDGKMNNKRVK